MCSSQALDSGIGLIGDLGITASGIKLVFLSLGIEHFSAPVGLEVASSPVNKYIFSGSHWNIFIGYPGFRELA